MTPFKTCTRCLRPWPAGRDHFDADRRASDGLVSCCKDCRRAADRLRRFSPAHRRRKADQARWDRLRAGVKRFRPRRKYPELAGVTALFD